MKVVASPALVEDHRAGRAGGVTGNRERAALTGFAPDGLGYAVTTPSDMRFGSLALVAYDSPSSIMATPVVVVRRLDAERHHPPHGSYRIWS